MTNKIRGRFDRRAGDGIALHRIARDSLSAALAILGLTHPCANLGHFGLEPHIAEPRPLGSSVFVLTRQSDAAGRSLFPARRDGTENWLVHESDDVDSGQQINAAATVGIAVLVRLVRCALSLLTWTCLLARTRSGCLPALLGPGSLLHLVQQRSRTVQA